MEEKDFLEKVADQFENRPAVLDLNSVMRNLDGWSSLTALSIMAMCSEEYGVILSAEEMEKSIKVSDIYNLVKSRCNG